jgi:DNA invertase Pin-like site-specific DNA recombinase
MNASKRFILYLRCSSDQQNTDLQRIDLEEYAKRRGWKYEVFEDKATGTNSMRPMLKRLMQQARSRKIDGLAVWRCDRLFRSLKEAVITLAELTELGVEFYSHKDGIDLSTSQGRLLANLLMSFAEFESELIRSRVRGGLIAAKARGVKLGRPQVITEAIVKQVIELRYNSNYSIKQIREALGMLSKTSIERICRSHLASISSAKR